METAIEHGVPGIEAECGGACACSEVAAFYIEEDWREKVDEPSPMEKDMLDFAYEGPGRIRVSVLPDQNPRGALDGLTVRTPEPLVQGARRNKSEQTGTNSNPR